MSNIPVGTEHDSKAPWNQKIRLPDSEEDYDDWFEEEYERNLDAWDEEMESRGDEIRNNLKTK